MRLHDDPLPAPVWVFDHPGPPTIPSSSGIRIADLSDAAVTGPSDARQPFLQSLTPQERDELLSIGVTRPLRPGTHLVVEGARDSHVELLRRGYVKVTRSVNGAPQLLGIRLPGDIIGELGAMTGNPRQATVTACDGVESTVLRRADFLQFLVRWPRVATVVTATVGARLDFANARRAEFATFPVHIRLARILGDIAVRCGEAAGDSLTIGVGLNQSELASLAGAAEDTVQRELRLLRRLGLIETGYRRLVIRDLDALLKLADEGPA